MLRAAIAFAVCAVPALAWPCGDSGGSSGGSSSGGDSGGGSSCDSGSSSSSSSSTPSCVEVSGVVGRQQCGRFGTWDVTNWPRLRISFGLSSHTFAPGSLTYRGTASHDDSITYIVTGEDAYAVDSSATAFAFDLRLTGSVTRHIYTGVEGSLGGAGLADTRIMESPAGLKVEPAGGAVYLAGGAVLGVGLPLGNVVAKAEVFAGYRAIGVPVTTRHDDCVDESTAFAGDWVAQPRVSLEYWSRPWMTLGAWLGADTFGAEATSGGIFMRHHTRAFDAQRGR